MPLHFLVSYLVADHAFVNSYKLKDLEKLNYWKHFIWAALVFLAFTFDSLLTTSLGILLFAAAVAGELGVLYLRKVLADDFVEVIAFGYFLLLSFLSRDLFENSYVTTQFCWYLLGMLLATVGVTYFFRKGVVSRVEKDSVGISERLALYIFTFAGLFEWLAIVVLAGILYRLFFSKTGKIEWLLSPILGIGFSLLWLFIMRGVF
ncbi:hypothetical protein AT15_10240 [Kosmotoga arenicorallina S304]|uniref:Uncharacterized protein n=1 Tax=Kosmotoga arenicorallina S304 TaxID=1453497 RepID=A0A176K1C8_9BACT|nr:hypothetical protein [Kosmotoga arenicorallina]OAA30411.1 hypothetical protein AT15_10240 [Kosmotoga arenicorallina S304]